MAAMLVERPDTGVLQYRAKLRVRTISQGKILAVIVAERPNQSIPPPMPNLIVPEALPATGTLGKMLGPIRR